MLPRSQREQLEWMARKPGLAARRRGRAVPISTPLGSPSDQILCSLGAQRVRDDMRGKWLVNLVAASQLGTAMRGVERQFWHLKRPASRNRYEPASLTCHDASGTLVWSETILTDFRAPGIRLFVSGGLIMLPEEAPHVQHVAKSMVMIVRRAIRTFHQR